MKLSKADIIRIALFLLWFSTIPVKAEAALHPWFGVDEFRSAYNSLVIEFNAAHPDYRIPKLLYFSQRKKNLYTAYFDVPYPQCLMAIETQPNGRIKSIVLSKRIKGFTVVAGRRIPKEYVEFSDLGVLILTAIGYPIEDQVCNLSVQGTFKKMLEKDIIGENTEILYNPLLGILYCLDMRVHEGFAHFAIVNRNDYIETN